MHQDPKPSLHRKVLTAVVGASFVGFLLLIGVMLLTDFPGPPQGSADQTGAPPEDARG